MADETNTLPWEVPDRGGPGLNSSSSSVPINPPPLSPLFVILILYNRVDSVEKMSKPPAGTRKRASAKGDSFPVAVCSASAPGLASLGCQFTSERNDERK